MQQAINPSAVQVSPGLSISVLKQLLGAVLLGGLLLYGAGFASMNVAHSVAHDTRHAFAFPCH